MHDLYEFIMSDPVDAWKDAAPFPLALKKASWTDNPRCKSFPHVNEILKARTRACSCRDRLVFNELADAMHRAVQNIMLNKADIKTTLDEAAAEMDRATAAYKKA